MARIMKIEIEGKSGMALFDTGAIHTYVRSDLARGVPRVEVPTPARVAIGGKVIEIKELCFVRGKIEGLDFVAGAVPVDELGEADGHKLDLLIGARTLEQSETKLHPRTGELDLEGLTRREFTEF